MGQYTKNLGEPKCTAQWDNKTFEGTLTAGGLYVSHDSDGYFRPAFQIGGLQFGGGKHYKTYKSAETGINITTKKIPGATKDERETWLRNNGFLT